jgi:phosphatidylglycerol:prolipoprotein diacylglycerol transferase
MHPILLKLGPFTLHTYGALLVIAFVTVTWLAVRSARRLPPALVAIEPDQLVDFTSLALLGGLVGSRLLYVVLEWEHFAQHPAAILAIWEGGLIWYGGFAGGLLAGWLYARAKRLDFIRVADQCIPFLALGHAIGRMGCFFNGCCYGKPTQGWCGVQFPEPAGPVLPTQLFESLGLFLLFGILRACQRPAILARPGRLFGGYLAGYGLLRFGIEFLRGDQSVWWAGLTLPQLVSLGLAAVGAGLVMNGKSQTGKRQHHH